MNTRMTLSAVLEFGRNMLVGVLGDGYPGTAMLAGGAFKSLIHGRPPRDLDIWAPDETERGKLVAHLLSRGAAPLPDRRYSSAFSLANLEIEIPKKCDRVGLDVHLSRVDIGIAAVALQVVDGRFTAAVHPLAVESEQRRMVLFVKPLANWRHCLGCLARAHRYAVELDWQLPQSEVQFIWDIFDKQDPETQAGMLERGSATALPDALVLAEAQRRAHH